jgi:hypothetical protein
MKKLAAAVLAVWPLKNECVFCELVRWASEALSM